MRPTRGWFCFNNNCLGRAVECQEIFHHQECGLWGYRASVVEIFSGNVWGDARACKMQNLEQIMRNINLQRAIYFNLQVTPIVIFCTEIWYNLTANHTFNGTLVQYKFFAQRKLKELFTKKQIIRKRKTSFQATPTSPISTELLLTIFFVSINKLYLLHNCRVQIEVEAHLLLSNRRS